MEIDDPLMPAMGRVDTARRLHIFPVRVYYEDTDAAGIVYYGNYLKFAERARTEMLRLLGRGQQRMLEDEGIAFAVRNCRIDYHRPARLDDALEIHTALLEIGGASLRVSQKVVRAQELIADIVVRLAVLDRRGRAVRLPRQLRDRLAAAANPAGDMTFERGSAPAAKS